MDRLYKKGLLSRTKVDRAYFYQPRFTRAEWRRKQAEDLVAGFLSGRGTAGELLVSCLVDAVGHHDAALLDDLEERIRLKREELEKERQE
jgi:predicted transcriptional regulator